MSTVEIVAAGLEDKPVIGHLLELYAYDFSEFNHGDVDAGGRYGYPYLDQYWTEPERRPFLFRIDGRWAGFALVRAGSPHDMAEFFVMRKYRRRGVGIRAARAVLAACPGEWQVRQVRANAAATSFWHRAIPVEFTETVNEEGPVQRFTIGD
jgi:predicted acetyltransferase